MRDLIRKLSLLPGVSGNEAPVHAFIKEELKDDCTFLTDRLGNLIAFKKGKEASPVKWVIAAHMDEVGFIVTYLEEDGLLRFTTVGGIDERVIIGRTVLVGEKGIPGVIGTKAVHMQSAEERKQVMKVSELFIDIGAKDKKEAEEVVRPGDTVVFESAFREFGDGFIKGKALDDRAGCAILIKLAKMPLRYDTYFAFTVQEEVGARGAKTAAYSIDPDAAIVVDVTTAADVGGTKESQKVCKAGEGPVLSFMDRATSYDRRALHALKDIAKEKGLKSQLKLGVYGGNDAGSIHVSRGGVRTLAVSLPGRYIHSASCVLKYSDMEDTLALLKAACDQQRAIFGE